MDLAFARIISHVHASHATHAAASTAKSMILTNDLYSGYTARIHPLSLADGLSNSAPTYACASACGASCAVCDAGGSREPVCLECALGQFAYRGLCLPDCPKGFVQEGLASLRGRRCRRSCDPTCHTCTILDGVPRCEVCVGPAVLHNGKCQDDCPSTAPVARLADGRPYTPVCL